MMCKIGDNMLLQLLLSTTPATAAGVRYRAGAAAALYAGKIGDNMLCIDWR